MVFLFFFFVPFQIAIVAGDRPVARLRRNRRRLQRRRNGRRQRGRRLFQLQPSVAKQTEDAVVSSMVAGRLAGAGLARIDRHVPHRRTGVRAFWPTTGEPVRPAPAAPAFFATAPAADRPNDSPVPPTAPDPAAASPVPQDAAVPSANPAAAPDVPPSAASAPAAASAAALVAQKTLAAPAVAADAGRARRQTAARQDVAPVTNGRRSAGHTGVDAMESPSDRRRRRAGEERVGAGQRPQRQLLTSSPRAVGQQQQESRFARGRWFLHHQTSPRPPGKHHALLPVFKNSFAKQNAPNVRQFTTGELWYTYSRNSSTLAKNKPDNAQRVYRGQHVIISDGKLIVKKIFKR